MSRRATLFALVCAVIGLVVSIAAAYVHYRLLYDPTYRSFCDVSSRISCTEVYISRFSTVRGVPVAIFGAMWFVIAGLLSTAALRARDSVRESVPGYLFVLSTLALAIILYLAYASFVILKAVCLLCLVTYAAVIGLLLVSGPATTFPMTPLPRRAARDLRMLAASPLAIAIAVLFVGGAVSTLAFFPRESSASETPAPLNQNQRSDLEQFLATAQRVPIVIPTEGARVLIVKFNDYQCPACGQSYLAYKPILAKYQAQSPGAVKMVLKDYPLNPGCNAGVAMVHGAACEAAVAVRLAKEHNRGDA